MYCGERGDEDWLWDDGLVGFCRLVGVVGCIELDCDITMTFSSIVTDVP